MSVSSHLHVNYPSGAGKRKFGTEHTRAQGNAWLSPLASSLATFVYHSFTEQINTLVTGFQGKVLVPFPAEWQVAPPGGKLGSMV